MKRKPGASLVVDVSERWSPPAKASLSSSVTLHLFLSFQLVVETSRRKKTEKTTSQIQHKVLCVSV